MLYRMLLVLIKDGIVRLLNWFNKLKFKKSEMIASYKAVFGGRQGQIVLADICRHGMVDELSFSPDSQRLTDFNEGRRAMALHILNMLQLNPNDFVNEFYIGQGDTDDERGYEQYATTDGLDFG